MSAPTVVWILLAGAAGAVLRHVWAQWWIRRRPARPRDGIAVVNALGSFALGVVVTVLPDEAPRLILGTGLLGGLTTFSTWLVDAIDADRLGRDVLLHVGLGLPAALAGVILGAAVQSA